MNYILKVELNLMSFYNNKYILFEFQKMVNANKCN